MTRWMAALVGAVVLASALAAPVGAARFDTTSEVSWRLGGYGRANSVVSNAQRVFVGGDFTSIDDPAGGTVPQARLAAFDAVTGEPDRGFAPTLNGTVRALALSPDGSRLFVGGEFTAVNGSTARGLVELDPRTGATVPGVGQGTQGRVYDMVVVGDVLYAVGYLSRLGTVSVQGAGRIRLATGLADPSWTPSLVDGSAQAVAVHPSSGYVVVGGFFNAVNGDWSRSKLAMLSGADGSTVSAFAPGRVEEVFDLAATDDKLYIAHGGPGGRADVRDPRTGVLLRTHQTDGDVQAVEVSGDRVYFGHHGEVVNGVSSAWLFAVDRATDDVVSSFDPRLWCRAGVGVWAVHDSGRHLWVGGAITGAAPVDGRGVVRYPVVADQVVDVTPPSTPSGLRATLVGDDEVRLAWEPAVDSQGGVYYRVRRDGRVVGTASSAFYTDASAVPGTVSSYRVEAVDGWGNNTTSDPLEVATLASLVDVEAFGLGATWHYLDSGIPTPGWGAPGYDAVGWEVGRGQFGRGDGDERTLLDEPPGDSVTVYFRSEFDLAPGSTVAVARLDILRDDGVLVRINGTEVLRDNLPPGSIDATTRALTWESANEDTVFSHHIDPTVFTSGTNVVTAEVHNVSRTGDLSFDAGLELGIALDDQPPSQPVGLMTTAVSSSAVSLAWQPSTDDGPVLHYEVRADGVVVGQTASTAFVDRTVAPGSTYTYDVRAIDGAGNRSDPSAGLVVTTPAAPVDVTPPSPPTSLRTLAVTDSTVELAWAPSDDDVAVVEYQVWRDGVQVATAESTSLIDRGRQPSTTYGYRVAAVDAAGNRSDWSSRVEVTTDPVAPAEVVAIPFRSRWSYNDSGVYPGSGWVLSAFDDAAWPEGTGEFGAGDGDEVTVVVNRPTLWLRSTMEVSDPDLVDDVRFDVVADDGVVVFVNGIEVIRDNVGPGDVDGSASAPTYRWGAAEQMVRSFSVPPGVLTAGTNVVAVAVVNAPGSSDLSFDLEAVVRMGEGGDPDVTPPSRPTGLTADQVTDRSARLTWTSSVDDVGVASYDVTRDGQVVAQVAGTEFVDIALAPLSDYRYTVLAVDGSGNRSPASAELSVRTTGEPAQDIVLLGSGSVWQYLDTGVWVPGWEAPGFDSGGWSTGRAPLAAVDPGTTMVSNRPTIWLRHILSVPDRTAVADLELVMAADDGAVVYLNGVEVVRDNVPAGVPDGTTSAATYRWGAAEQEYRRFVLPVDVLVDGTNTIAVALLNARDSGDMWFDLELRAAIAP